MAKSLCMQAWQAIGKSYEREHSTQTVQAMSSSINTFTEHITDKYGLEKIDNLKPQMIQSYFLERIENGISISTLTKDATAIRMICEAIDKQNICPRTNDDLGFTREADDRYNPQNVNTEKIEQIREALAERADKTGLPENKALLAAHDLRSEFGVRANESFMSKVVGTADGKLSLEVLGAKGGLRRTLEPQTTGQQKALEQYRDTSREIGNAHGKLIPPDMSARQFYDYQRNTNRSLGATKENHAHMHCQRHAYAQERVERGDDRLDVSHDLGHGREEVIYHYVA